MNVLITGSSGFTGSLLRDRLVGRGHRVFGLTTTPQVPGDLYGDLLDPASLKDCLDRSAPDAVVHLAGIASPVNLSVSEIYNSNVVGTLNLLEALVGLRQPPKVCVVASSATVYAPGDAWPLDEDAAVEPRGHYATSKRTVEDICRLMADRLPITVTRPFNYTGPGQSTAFLVPKIVEHFALKKPVLEVGNLDLVRDISSVADVVEAYIRLVEQPRPGQIYNFCSGVGVHLRSLVDLAAEISGHRLEVRQVAAYTRSGEAAHIIGSRGRLNAAIGDWDWTPLRVVIERMLEHHSAP